ncbi:MAG: PorT family protein [Prevotellaceae bacterium]|jgi:opacity protein-like surface antigen|nr:PorT family protein [Prevotellaceae bacterium]
MKKIIVILSAMMLITVSVNAQIGVKYGLKAGLNVSQFGSGTLKGDGQPLDIEASGMLAGFHAGGMLNVNFGGLIGIQPEVQFSMQGETEDDGGETLKTTLGFINVPILVDIQPIPNLSILVGPQVGFNVYRSMSEDGVSVSGSTLDERLEAMGMKINTLDFAAVLGVQYTLLGHLTVGARYNFGLTPALGLTSVAKDAGMSLSGGAHRVIQVSVGWFF